MSDIKLKSILDVFNAIGALAGDGKNVKEFIDALAGSSGDLQALLVDLNHNVVAGFQDVVDAINDEALSAEWSKINQTLNYIGTTLMEYQSALGTVVSPTAPGGPYLITYNSDSMDFIDWCDGYASSSGAPQPSALDEMSSWVNAAPLSNNYLSLAGIFYEATSFGTGAIPLVRQMASSAQGNPGGVHGNMAYDTEYNTVFDFMEAIFKLVSLTYYVHDSALSLRNMILGKKIGDSGRQSVMGTISTNFGNVTTEGSIWGQFANELSALATTTPDVKVSAFSPALFPPTVVPQVHERKSDHNWSFLPHEVKVGDIYKNAFLTGISVVHVQGSDYPEGQWHYRDAYLALIGNVVQVGPAPTTGGSPVFTPMPPVPEKSFYESSDNWIAPREGEPWHRIYYNGAFVCGTCEPSYAPVPPPSSNNHIRVVTGFKFVLLNNGDAFNAAIALQFGELDLSDLSNPSVTIDHPDFVSPEFTQQADLQQFLVTSPVGDYSSGALGKGVVTSVRLADHDLQGGPSCINVQMVPTFYMADFYQPTHLKPIIAS